MGLSDFFRKLLGSGESKAAAGETVEYEGFTIRPAPKPQGGQFLTAGVISKQFSDGVKEQSFIRADTHTSRDDACAHTIVKARQIIDEQGDSLFRDS